MCNLQDIIDNSPLIAIEKSAYEDQNEFNRLLQESTKPRAINDKSISFTCWNFDVAANIYSRAKPNEILEGWAFLSNNNVPLIIYTKAFYVPSLYAGCYIILNRIYGYQRIIKTSKLRAS